MTLCDDGHDEVCYDARNCPACEQRIRAERAEEEIGELKDQIKELQS